MKLHFTYDAEKDRENLIRGAKSVNSSELTPFHKLYIAKYGDELDPAKIDSFIKEYLIEKGINIESEITSMEKAWLVIARPFIERCEKMFGLKYPTDTVVVYLTTNNRCTYNIEKAYFFVRISGKDSNATIMHELLHFYTYQAFHDALRSRGLTSMQYNDIKESLTELLNVEFVDFMDRLKDYGYPQHAEIRKRFRVYMQEGKSLSEAVDGLATML